ncbi:MAG: sigma-54-dependent Fis family transcriptional regulator, partial [Citromicrobium sp.]|nr:sigma-54-dependent Fis family transcriptional regulator [Citromicrobium sp.]
PFRLVNVAGVPVNSIESALFGHEKGAFAGAFESQMGALQHCDTGTLILDEIDRLSADQQARLAATLKDGIVRPIGATHGFRIDTRLLSASNRLLSELAAKGQFDQDLLAAISSTRITLPPLRERAGDIPALARHFLARIGDEPGLRHLSLADSALHLLCAFDWPGNVRQLQAVLFRAAVFCDAEMLTASDFPQLSELIGEQAEGSHHVQEAVGVMLYTEDGNLRPLEEIEADVIRLAIGHYRGRMTEVARRLGIGRSTLYRKLSDLGIDNAA